MTLLGLSGGQVRRLVDEAVSRGLNFFDVAPSYGEGEAERKLGCALAAHRGRVFLAGKTLERSGSGARMDLEASLRRLATGHLDLFQLHAVNRAADVEAVLAPGGALEMMLRAREEGIIRYVGFSSHSVPAALTLLDSFHFDSIMFPVNFVSWDRGNFGPQVLARAQARGVRCLAIKALASCPWRKGEERRYPNCWYRPIDDPASALLALRFALSEDVCAVLPPADERLVRLALDLAPHATHLSAEERARLLEMARSLKPIMTAPRRA